MILVLYIIFPILCVGAITSTSRKGAFAERLVFGLALYEFLLILIGTLLGSLQLLTVQIYSVVTCFTALLLAIQTYRNGFSLNLNYVHRWLRTRRGALAIFLATLLVLVLGLEIGIDALFGTKHIDGLWYHIPRLLFWRQQHDFAAWATPVFAQIGLPVSADVALGQKIFLGSGWRGIGYVTGIISLGAIGCIYVAALDLRLTRWHAAMASILFGSFPAIGLRIWSVNTDILAAFPVLASYVALHRIRDVRLGLSMFLVLNGAALACKPTVAPLAVLLSCIALWQCRMKISKLRKITLPCLAVVLSFALVYLSYLPVYEAFSDFLGGDYSRAHESGSVTVFTHAVAMNTGHWLLEPLGYLTPVMKTTVCSIAKSVYNLVGAQFETLPEMWKPWPAQDIGRTGLASVLMLPFLLAWLPLRSRITAAVLFLLGYIPLSGMISAQPYSSRYNVVIFAGYALIWGSTRIFQRGNRRWVLFGLVALNVCALLGVVIVRSYVDNAIKSKPGGTYDYVSENNRKIIASNLNGNPLLVITDGTLDSLLVGTDVEYPLSYIVCPADGDWEKHFRKASLKSNWLTLVHNGETSMRGGSEWQRPGFNACPQVPTQMLDDALASAGWRLCKSNNILNIYNFNNGISGQRL